MEASMARPAVDHDRGVAEHPAEEDSSAAQRMTRGAASQGAQEDDDRHDRHRDALPASVAADDGEADAQRRADDVSTAQADDIETEGAEAVTAEVAEPDPLPDAQVEHVVILEPPAPVNTDRLVALTSSLRPVGSKPGRAASVPQDQSGTEGESASAERDGGCPVGGRAPTDRR